MRSNQVQLACFCRRFRVSVPLWHLPFTSIHTCPPTPAGHLGFTCPLSWTDLGRAAKSPNRYLCLLLLGSPSECLLFTRPWFLLFTWHCPTELLSPPLSPPALTIAPASCCAVDVSAGLPSPVSPSSLMNRAKALGCVVRIRPPLHSA